jgi:hypothetical protein
VRWRSAARMKSRRAQTEVLYMSRIAERRIGWKAKLSFQLVDESLASMAFWVGRGMSRQIMTAEFVAGKWIAKLMIWYQMYETWSLFFVFETCLTLKLYQTAFMMLMSATALLLK